MSRRRYSAYDETLDRELWGKTVRELDSPIRVSVRQYDGARPKVAICRPLADHRKLGRMTTDETRAVLPVLLEAYDYLRTLDVSMTKKG